MEDSSFVDLMDINEYLLDEWDFTPSLFEEGNEDGNGSNSNQNNSSDHKETEDKGQGFELVCERPTKQMKNKKKTCNSSSSSSSSPSSSPLPQCQLISFSDGNAASPSIDAMNLSEVMDMEQFRQGVSCKKPSGRRQPRVMKEHVIAERQRRKRLSESLIALSALIPGLKRMDKATVLEDAIVHLKQLKERVKQLEEERASMTTTMESLIFSHVTVDKYSCSSSDTQSLPLIKASVSDNDMLIKIHCDKAEGCFRKILSATEKLGLDVVNSFTLPFGNSSLYITILAKMNNNVSRSVKDVMKNIRSAIVE